MRGVIEAWEARSVPQLPFSSGADPIKFGCGCRHGRARDLIFGSETVSATQVYKHHTTPSLRRVYCQNDNYPLYSLLLYLMYFNFLVSVSVPLYHVLCRGSVMGLCKCRLRFNLLNRDETD